MSRLQVQHREKLNAPGHPGCICFPCVLERRIAQLEEALKRATLHGLPGDTFCAVDGWELQEWVNKGMSGPLPEVVCPFCKEGVATNSHQP